MKINNGDCIHIVRYGTFNENRYFLAEYRDSFDLIGINSNIIAHAPAGIAAFIASLKNKDYFIDPQTHAFQQDPECVKRKKEGVDVLMNSIRNLSIQYGSVIESNAGVRSLEARDFSDDVIKVLCMNVLRFELNIVQDYSKDLEEWQYLEGQDNLDLRPNIVVAPYLHIQRTNIKEQLAINKKFIIESKKMLASGINSHGKPLFAQLVVDKEVIRNPGHLSDLISIYSACDVDGFLIWIDEFSEVAVTEPDLIAYVSMLEGLCSAGKPILDLHGSYFSMVLAARDKSLLAGVGHGIEYGEDRPVVPVRGGVPRAKFYFPQFHERLRYDPDATNVLLEMGWTKSKDKYLRNVCSCQVCSKLIDKDVVEGFAQFGKTKISEKNGQAYPTADALYKSRRHYLNTKLKEFEFCRSTTLQGILEDLESSRRISEQIKSYSFNHLQKWINVLGS